jgi:hypothetical protein
MTPQVGDVGAPNAGRFKADRETRDPDLSGNYRMDLHDQVGLLAGCSTPRATDGEKGGPNQTGGALPADAALAGWATPTAHEKARSEEFQRGRELNAREALAGWATPAAQPANSTPENFLRRKREAIERGATMGVCLSDLQMQAVAWLAGWATPAARDHKSEEATEEFNEERWAHPRGKPLSAQALTAASGETPGSSTAATGSTAGFRLNPLFSLWLMGFPAAWGSCGARAMRSARRPRRRSSGRSSKPPGEPCEARS